MIHICYLTGCYTRRDALIYYRHGLSMAKKGHRVSIVVCDDEPDETVDGIDIYSTHFKPKGHKDRFFKTRKKLLDIADKIDADIYQITDPEHLSMVSHFRKREKAAVFNVREFYPNMIGEKNYIPKPFRNICVKLFEYLMRHYLPKYGAVFAVTPELVKELKDKYDVGKSFLLTNFPIPDDNYTLEKDNYMQREDTLLYEGTVYSESCQEVVLDAIDKIPRLNYLVAGVIHGNYNYIKDNSIWKKRVEFIDGFTLEQLKDFFSRSTISNCLRDFKGKDGSLGVIKIFESMEAALPVLLSDVPSYREIVKKYHCGFCVDPTDSEAVEKAISYLVEHKEEAYEMGQNGRRAVQEEYNWWKQFETYEREIYMILKNNGCPPKQ